MTGPLKQQSTVTPWSHEDGTIRVTATGQPSVFDMIRVLGGQKNPRDVWQRLTNSHSEVVGMCYNLKFPGPGQRETPVAKTKEDAYYILGLLPGTVGKKYREDAAKLFVAFLEDPAKLAEEISDRLSPEEQERLEARLNTKRTRFPFTDSLKDAGVHGHGYGLCTNAIYEPVLGADATTLKERVAESSGLVAARVNPRDHMTIRELRDIETAERIATGQVKRSEAYGNRQVEQVVRRSAEYTRMLLDGEISIPGLT